VVRFPLQIHKPLADKSTLSPQSSSHNRQPQAHRPQRRRPVQMHTPMSSMCKAEAGGVGWGRAGHAVVTEAEASRTDLETPVVWLLMETREEMVIRDC